MLYEVITHRLGELGVALDRLEAMDLMERVNPDAIDRIACTGRKFRELVNLSTIAEPEAVEYAYRFVITSYSIHYTKLYE